MSHIYEVLTWLPSANVTSNPFPLQGRKDTLDRKSLHTKLWVAPLSIKHYASTPLTKTGNSNKWCNPLVPT